ncbi:MAG: hypothetical protein NVSMB64_29890 [Candidatus Velthaea sp.]
MADKVVVVDPTGRILDAGERAAAENRAQSDARNHALARGMLDPAVLAREAEYVQPQPVNPSPTQLVPFTFNATEHARAETLNANFAHLGNLMAGVLQAQRTFIAALDSMTARLDRYEVPGKHVDRVAEVRKANAAERKEQKVDAEAGIEQPRKGRVTAVDNTEIVDRGE